MNQKVTYMDHWLKKMDPDPQFCVDWGSMHVDCCRIRLHQTRLDQIVLQRTVLNDKRFVFPFVSPLFQMSSFKKCNMQGAYRVGRGKPKFE